MLVAAIRHMQTKVLPNRVPGWIVTITAVDAFKAHPQNAHDAATKAAVVKVSPKQ